MLGARRSARSVVQKSLLNCDVCYLLPSSYRDLTDDGRLRLHYTKKARINLSVIDYPLLRDAIAEFLKFHMQYAMDEDLVLTEYKMVDMDSWSLLRSMRGDEYGNINKGQFTLYFRLGVSVEKQKVFLQQLQSFLKSKHVAATRSRLARDFNVKGAENISMRVDELLIRGPAPGEYEYQSTVLFEKPAILQAFNDFQQDSNAYAVFHLGRRPREPEEDMIHGLLLQGYLLVKHAHFHSVRGDSRRKIPRERSVCLVADENKGLLIQKMALYLRAAQQAYAVGDTCAGDAAAAAVARGVERNSAVLDDAVVYILGELDIIHPTWGEDFGYVAPTKADTLASIVRFGHLRKPAPPADDPSPATPVVAMSPSSKW
ncbi:MAG: hypothetical protein P1U34_07390 [Coxiellaceae bacterium]|nr:hypothetical protein [Coxiellaceae bacterium]